MKFGLDEATIEKLSKVFETNPKVDKALLFGSRAKGTYREDSDIDVALKGYDISLNDVLQLSAALEDEGITYKVDLVNYDSIKEPALVEHIDRVGVEVYSRWKKYDIEELLKKRMLAIGDGYRAKNSELSSSGIPFARAGNIDNGFDFRNADFFPLEDLYKVGAKKSQVGDTVFTSKGTVGRFAYVTEAIPEFVYSPQLCYWRSLDAKKIDPYFLYYWMHSSEFLNQVHEVKGQTDMADYVSLTDQRRMKISLPPIDYQRITADVLVNIDDKIDLLYRQNKTLEGLAEALFRQWFVEEAGEGWEDGKIDDLFVLQRGYDLPTQTRVEGQYPVFAASGFNGYHNQFRVAGPGVTTGRSGVIGEVFFIDEDFWPLNTSLFVKEFRRSTPLFTYYLLKSLGLNSLNAGSAVPTLNRNHVHAIGLALPPDALIQEFEGLAKTQFQKIKTNAQQIHILTALRDSLLPKLLSGEIRVEIYK